MLNCKYAFCVRNKFEKIIKQEAEDKNGQACTRMCVDESMSLYADILNRLLGRSSIKQNESMHTPSPKV